MRLVDDDRIVAPQQRIALRLRQQNAIGHQLDIGVGRHLVGETHLVTHRLSQWRFQFLRDARGHRARGNAPRLRVADQSFDAALQLQTDFRQLRGFARTRFTANDDHLIFTDRARDVRAPRHHGQIVGIGGLRQIRKSSLKRCRGLLHQSGHKRRAFYSTRRSPPRQWQGPARTTLVRVLPQDSSHKAQ